MPKRDTYDDIIEDRNQTKIRPVDGHCSIRTAPLKRGGNAMQSSIIGKIEKAKRYAKETDRVTFQEMSIKFRGENSDYDLNFKDGKWRCTCSFFSKWGLCSHTMALEQILGIMLPPEARNAHLNAAGTQANS